MTDDELAWRVLERETAYSCPGFDVVCEEVETPAGTRTDFDYLTEPPSVVILPFTAEDELVVIDEWRQAVGRRNRGFPAGTTEPEDVDLATAARRELEEETGYLAADVEPLLVAEPANGLASIEHHYFVATGCTPDGSRSLDPDETIRVDTVTYESFLAAALSGELRDGRTLLGLLYYDATR